MADVNLIPKQIRRVVCLVILLILAITISVTYAQTIYQGPAFGSITGGAIVTTGSFDGAQISGEPDRIMNREWERFEPPLIDDKYNNTPPAAPLRSNEFIDPFVALNPTVSEPPAVVVDFKGNPQTSSIPPDLIMAVGPNHVITMVNTSFIIWDKAGNVLFQTSADGWFSNIAPYSGAFDPVIIYDQFAERWVQLWDLQNDNNQTGYWLISVSDDSDPMGTWCNYSFPAHLNGMTQVPNWADYPKMGYDHQAIYVSGRQFGFGSGLQYCKLRIIPKSELYDPGCGPVNYSDFWNFRDPNNPSVVSDGPPIAPAHLDSTNGNTAYLIVDARYTVSTFITLWTIQDPLGTNPTVSAVNIPTTAALEPPNANQLGGGSPLIDSGRRAYRNAVYKNGQIWTSTAVAGGTANQYAFARYLRLDVNSQSVLEDVSFGANGYFYLYPAVMVDNDNNLTMVFTRSGNNEYAGAAYAGRLDSDPPGLSPSVLLKEGEANYVKTFGGQRNRWGDYMGIALDPVYNSTIWGFVEYAASPANTWGTWVGAFTHQYSVSGVVRDAVTLNPIEFARLEILETGRVIETDATGEFSIGSPTPDATINASAFGYQDTVAVLSLTHYGQDSLDILLQPEIESTITGQIKDSITGDGIYSELKFYAEGNPYPGPYDSTTTDANGFYNLTTIVGEYDIVISPEIPYPVTTVHATLESSPLTLDVELLPAAVLLVNDDTTAANEIFFQETLDQIGVSYFTWRIDESGIPDANTFNLFPDPKTVIWYTGNEDTIVLSDPKQQSLATFLDNGGMLLLTGQNIAESSDDGVLLTNYLGVEFNTNITPPIIRGITGDPIGDGLLLSSVGGAGNQVSKDALFITGAADTVLYYGTSAPLGIAAVRADDGAAGWKAVFLGFGVEGLNNSEGNRDKLVKRVMDWFGVISSVEDEPGAIATIPEAFELKQNYPNPFNPETTIEFAVPQNTRVEIKIFNLLGQEVRELVDGNQTAGVHRVIWDGRNEIGDMAPSGVYFYKMSTETGFQNVKKLLLLK